jgi:hypothetical protein
MDNVHFIIIDCFILLFSHHLDSAFIPNMSDYDAYGCKIAMNEILFVEVHNSQNQPTFSLQFAPDNSKQESLQCSINMVDFIDHYIYSIALSSNQTVFFFAGELINDKHGTFVGVGRIDYVSLVINMNQSESNLCDSSFSYSIQYLYQYEHQEHYILGVQPNGRYVYGLANKFVFIFDSNDNSTLKAWDGNFTWPDDSFMPHAVDMNDDFGVIAGFIQNAPDARVQCTPIIYLINFNSSNHHPIVVDQYIPIATNGTWQDFLTNSDAKNYLAKYDMSVSINERGYILVGMQFINRVFFLSVNLFKPTELTYISRYTNGRSLGYGKGVAWLDNGNMAAILANIYTLDYEWQSSQIDFYDMQSGIYNSNSTPVSVFPNYHQTLPEGFNSVFLNIISSPISLTLLDNDGNVLIFIPTPPGFFPSIPDTGSMPLTTSPQTCLPGTYKNQAGINDCILCPTGTKNPGNAHTQCIPCSTPSFCPLGSSGETPLSSLDTTIVNYPYPVSPSVTTFSGTLLNYMFGITSEHCYVVKSISWTLTVAGLALLIMFIMIILKYVVKSPKIEPIRKRIQSILIKTDLIGEGEYWVGGLISFAIITLLSCAYAFSYQFFHLYPIDIESVLYFSCDNTTVVNAVFESSVKSLGIPRINEEQEMINSLSNQIFTLNVDFVNTLVDCSAAEIQGLIGTSWVTLRWSVCENVNSTLFISIPLPHQHISVRVLLADINTIGAVRVGLHGDQYATGRYTLKELDFYKSFYKNGSLLRKYIPIDFTLTKVINETVSMGGEDSKFSGIFIPTFEVDLNDILLSSNEYILSTLSSTILLISIQESSYYEKNLQKPMAKKGEVFFEAILFTMVCLGLFRLLLLLYKLTVKPIRDLLLKKMSCLKKDKTKCWCGCESEN